LTEKRFYQFGPFRLDPAERVLRREGQPLLLPPKDVEVLIVLVQRAGHIVEKEELLQKVWPGVFIEEGNLSRRVFNLRQALGDSDGQTYIETVPRRGYRFVATVKEEGAEAPATNLATDPLSPAEASATAQQPSASSSTANRKKRLWFWPMAVAGVLALIAILASRHFLKAGGASGQKVMLAVLPFANLSGEANTDYFADGFTEEMITQLGQVQPARLGVIARTSAMRYKNTRQSAAQICQELGVHYMLEGSVRQAGDQLRITAQLIQASDQTHLWAESYDAPLTDVLRVQQEIAGKITNSLRMELLPAHAGRAPDAPLNPEAYRRYLLSLHESLKGTREGEEKAIRYLQDAVAAEPANARYFAALAAAYADAAPYYLAPLEAYPRARQAAQRALELDPNQAGAHAILGQVHLLHDWNWPAAEAEYRRALELNPSSPEAQGGYADYLSTLGRHEEALSHIQQLYRVDPLAVDGRVESLWPYYFSGRIDETIAQARKTIEVEPQSGAAFALLALAQAEKGRPGEVLQAAEQAARLSDSPGVMAVAASALARAGEKNQARQFMERSLQLAQKGYVCRFLVAAAYADLGEKEKALESLERGYRERSS
jgi:TolB-like protein/DNA-binding winged helix-turn-helix (wHTH) protein/Flp pilus assembly protein TadD